MEFGTFGLPYSADVVTFGPHPLDDWTNSLLIQSNVATTECLDMAKFNGPMAV